jgi:hypothetical protein
MQPFFISAHLVHGSEMTKTLSRSSSVALLPRWRLKLGKPFQNDAEHFSSSIPGAPGLDRLDCLSQYFFSRGPLAKSPSSRGPRKRGGQITRLLSEPLWNLEHRRQWTIQQSPSSEDHGFTGRRALKFVEAVWLLATGRVLPFVVAAGRNQASRSLEGVSEHWLRRSSSPIEALATIEPIR